MKKVIVNFTTMFILRRVGNGLQRAPAATATEQDWDVRMRNLDDLLHPTAHG